MTSITVQGTGFGIVVAEDGDADAATLLDGLPPLRAARYLTTTPALRQALRDADAELVDAVLPHLDGAVVVPEAGLAGAGDDGEAASTRLAQALGVSVIAPEGRFIRCEGTLFSVGGGDGWIAQSPRGARVAAGRRYPAPTWQSQLPQDLSGAAHIPAGLWITSGTEPRHAVRLAGVAVRERQLLVVVGSPSEPAPSEERLLAVLRSLPAETRSAVVLAGFGDASLPLETVRALAAALEQPLRIAHGVEIGGAPARIDGDGETLPATLALESVCAPDGTITLERWAAPPGLAGAGAASYRLGETPRRRRRAGDRWVVDVVAAGLVVRSEDEPLADAAELSPPVGSLGVFVQCDGAQRPAALPALLEPLRERLAQRGAVTLHPIDAAARRVVRDAYPGAWAPTEALAITADGRLVAATADASGDTVDPDVAHADAASVGVASHDAVGDDPVVDDAAIDDAAVDDAAVDDAVPAVEVDAPAAVVDGEPVDGAGEAPETIARTDDVDAVVRADPAATASQAHMEPSGRHVRDAVVSTSPSADDAAAAWYAAAAPRRAALAETEAEPLATVADLLPTAAEPRSTSAEPHSTSAQAPSAGTQPMPTDASESTPRPQEELPQPHAASDAVVGDGSVASRTSASAASDAIARALQGSAAARSLGGAARGTSAPSGQVGPTRPVDPEASPTASAGASLERGSRASGPSAPTIAQAAAAVRDCPPVAPASHAGPLPVAAGPVSAAPAATAPETIAPAVPAPAAAVAASVPAVSASAASAASMTAPATSAPAPAATPAPPAAAPHRSASPIDVPADARSTADQRHRVRSALGARYDVASRTVSQLLAQQPGMRVAAGDRSAMLTGLSLVRVFAAEPHADYDLDFHTCLAEGLSMLPTARSVVVRGIPVAIDATPGTVLRLRAPLVAAAADGPATGPAEALIWTTSGRRLDRVLHGAPGAADVVLPAGTRLRVLGSAAGPAPRLLLAEEGTDAEQALVRLQAAAEARGDLGIHADDRWLGDLPVAA
ncbi:hypothetical protein GCM10009846_31290 [Agrococcus versicolor]|uniref:Uncharacterized protein n=1 Tax=Agrococcus versicolor TaxID=501482 RepID=A0ABP5MQX0_9MICO